MTRPLWSDAGTDPAAIADHLEQVAASATALRFEPRPLPEGTDPALLHQAAIVRARRQLTERHGEQDRILAEEVRAIDDLVRTANLMVERLREWYALHAPEATRMVVDAKDLARLVAEHGDRDAVLAALQQADHAAGSLGTDLAEADMDVLQSFAQALRAVHGSWARLEQRVDELMDEVAPNVAAVAGPLIGARLISLAGSLQKLATVPAGTVQLYGAETALFRHLKEGSDPPKHGVLFQHPKVHQAPPWQRGSIAKAMAGAISLGAKADAFTGNDLREQLQAGLEKDLASIASRKPRGKPRGKPGRGPGGPRGGPKGAKPGGKAGAGGKPSGRPSPGGKPAPGKASGQLGKPDSYKPGGGRGKSAPDGKPEQGAKAAPRGKPDHDAKPAAGREPEDDAKQTPPGKPDHGAKPVADQPGGGPGASEEKPTPAATSEAGAATPGPGAHAEKAAEPAGSDHVRPGAIASSDASSGGSAGRPASGQAQQRPTKSGWSGWSGRPVDPAKASGQGPPSDRPASGKPSATSAGAGHSSGGKPSAKSGWGDKPSGGKPSGKSGWGDKPSGGKPKPGWTGKPGAGGSDRGGPGGKPRSGPDRGKPGSGSGSYGKPGSGPDRGKPKGKRKKDNKFGGGPAKPPGGRR